MPKLDSLVNLISHRISGLILLLMISVISWSCSSTTFAKKLEPRTFRKRTYRFCDPREIEDPIGKLCYRYCSRSLLWKKCKETKLIIEDLSDKDTFDKFRNAGFNVVDINRRL
jgi:hypothetical protein